MDANEHSVSFSMQTNVWLEVQARCRRQVQVIVDDCRCQARSVYSLFAAS